MKDKNAHSQGGQSYPGPGDLEKLLRTSGLRLSLHQIQQLWTYHQLLRQHNPELNLTRIHRFENMALKLYADSILPGRLIELPSPLLDLGTGAGMPGIPLKIAHPTLEVLLAEGRRKRVEFLTKALGELGFSGVRIIGKGINERFVEPVQGVITRAVGSMVETLRRVQGCLSSGGLVIFMKGPHCDEEIGEVGKSLGKEYELVKDLHYRIGNSPDRRRLVVFQRKSEPLWSRRAIAMKRHDARKIESEQNEIFKDLRRFLTARGIKKLQGALISGPKQIMEILRDFPGKSTAWVSAGDADPPPPDAPSHLKWYQLAPALFRTLDLFGTSHPLLVVRVPQISQWDSKEGLPQGCTVLVPFQDPENVGAVVRSAVAFGAAQVILLEESAHPFHPKALRASGGAALRAKLLFGPSIRELPREVPIVALSPDGKDISSFRFPESFGFLPGLEGPGLPDEWKSESVSIPIHMEVESLNAATATAIALYVWSRSVRD